MNIASERRRCVDQVRRPAQAHQHAGEKCVTQLLRCCSRVELGIQRQGRKGRSMGTGHLQMTHQQMTDHGLSPRQRIDTAALPIRHERITAEILREARHHSNRRCAGIAQSLTRTQQRIGVFQTSPTCATGSAIEGHP